MARRPKLTQHIPEGTRVMFTVPESGLTGTFWELILTDCQSSSGIFWGYSSSRGTECPEFHYTPPKKGCPFTAHELAVAGAEVMAEGRGLVSLREMVDGACQFAAMFVGNSHRVFCIWSTDAERAKPVNVASMQTLAREKIAGARQKRELGAEPIAAEVPA